MQASETQTAPAATSLRRGHHWGWMLALGILYILLGLIGMGMLVTLTLVSVLFLGFLLLVGGGAQLLETFKCTGWRGVLGHVAIGALYIVAGITVIADPVMASKIITVILAATLVAVGLMRIIMAFQVRTEPGWAWAAVAGVFTIGLGFVIMAEWPLSGLFVIGLFIAVEMLIQGFTYVGMALAARRA